MTYAVKEIFYSLQGEGANTGTPAVFLRFAGCNLWSGREKDRADALCWFCDTDFVGTDGRGGGRFAGPESLTDAVLAAWPRGVESRRFVVCTGGEPLLQLDQPLLHALHERRFRVAVETNGTQLAPPGVDWICVSPKAGASLVLRRGDELKLVYPQREAEPERFERLDFAHFFLQPMDGPGRARATRSWPSNTAERIRAGASACRHTSSSAFPEPMELSYRFGFDAAHRFTHFPEGHPNEGVHGHSFQVEVALRGEPDPRTGFIIDFAELEQACAEIRAALDHRMLNDIEGLDKPSLESLCLWIWRRLAPRFASLARVTVRRDSAGQSCTYTGA